MIKYWNWIYLKLFSTNWKQTDSKWNSLFNVWLIDNLFFSSKYSSIFLYWKIVRFSFLTILTIRKKEMISKQTKNEKNPLYKFEKKLSRFSIFQPKPNIYKMLNEIQTAKERKNEKLNFSSSSFPLYLIDLCKSYVCFFICPWSTINLQWSFDDDDDDDGWTKLKIEIDSFNSFTICMST